MLTLPAIFDKAARPYIALRGSVRMDDIPKLVDASFPKIFKWADEQGIEPTGGAFVKYNVIDMAGKLELECGIAPPGPVGEVDGFITGMLPAGRYASTIYTGPYSNLMDVNAVLIGWAKEKNLQWDMQETGQGDHFACRLEIYETDPLEEPNPEKWVTELAIKLAD